MLRYILSIFLCVVVLSIFSVSTIQVNANYFVVTAYYSPLPDQDYYAMGNYQAEVILNGQWIAWASGRGVFSWMLAAPQGYSFWTKIYLEWLGIWSVEDRGWAIVPAWERGYKHDRIDVWMWYGDEWLRRAMYWGKRTIPWYIVKRTSNTSINYYNTPAPAWTVAGFKKQISTPKVLTPAKLPDIFEVSLESGSNEILVSKLQSLLQELDYLDEDFIKWEYDDATFTAVYSFQVDSWILHSKESPGAGRYWPKTRAKLKEYYDAHLFEITKQQELYARFEELEKDAQNQAQNHIESLWNPVIGDISSEVRELQKMLAELWHFNHKDTAIFGPKTQEAIMSFQTENDLIRKNDDIWAGVFWPKTRGVMAKVLSEIYLQELLDTEDVREEYDIYILEK